MKIVKNVKNKCNISFFIELLFTVYYKVPKQSRIMS